VGAGEWGPECQNAEWLDGAIGPQLGARFRGHSWAARFAWTRVCTITELVPGRRFAYLTGGGLGDSTRWTFDLAAEGSRTRVRQSFEAVRFPRALELFVFAFTSLPIGTDGTRCAPTWSVWARWLPDDGLRPLRPRELGERSAIDLGLPRSPSVAY